MNDHGDSIEPAPLPQPLSLPEVLHSNKYLSLTPIKEKKAKTHNKDRSKKRSSRKVAFVENNYPPENSLSKPTLHTTNVLKRDIEKCQEDELSLDRALKEIQLSDSFNTAVNEQLTCFLNYKLDEKKYKNLISIQDDENVEEKPLVVPKKVNHVPKCTKTSELYKPDPMEFWNDDDFITERPCTDFDVDVSTDYKETDDDNDGNDDYEYLFYIYRKNNLQSGNS